MYDQSYKSLVKLKVSSFNKKLIKGTNSGHHRIVVTFPVTKNSMSCYSFEPLIPGFLISPIKPYITGPHNTPVLFLFLFFPMLILFSRFYITTYFSTSTSDLPAFYHSPLITDNHMLWSASKSYLFFSSYFSHRNFFSPLKYHILSHFSKNVELKY